MMNNINNLVGYQSKVLFKGKDKFGNSYYFNTHNEILEPMQALFARVLTGYDTTGYIPDRVDLLNDNSSILLQPIPITGKHTESIESNTVAILTTTIYSENIITDLATSAQPLYLQLMNSNNEYLNKVEVPSDIVTNISKGISLVIEWQIKLVNVSNKEN